MKSKKELSKSDLNLLDHLADMPKYPDSVITGRAGEFAKTYTQYIEGQPHIYFHAWLACAASLFADKITIPGKNTLSPRMYNLIVGPFGGKKSFPAFQAINLWKDATKDQIKTCFGVGSAEGLTRVLGKTPKLLLYIDELHSLTQKANIEGSTLMACLNSLFDHTFYENHTKNKDLKTEKAYLSLLSCCTIDLFRDLFSRTAVRSGLLSRFFLLGCKPERRFHRPGTIPQVLETKLQQDIQNICKFVLQLNKKNTPYVYPIDSRADDLFKQWYLLLPFDEISSRLDVYASKLSMLLALNEFQFSITLPIAEKTLEILQYQTKIRQYLEPLSHPNEIIDLEIKIVQKLSIQPESTLTERNLRRFLSIDRDHSISSFYKALKNLLDCQKIFYNTQKKGKAITLRIESDLDALEEIEQNIFYENSDEADEALN